MTWMTLLDLLLLTGLTLRLTRLIVGDDLGIWWVRRPLGGWAIRQEYPAPHLASTIMGREVAEFGWRTKVVVALACPFCVGFWITCLTVLSMWLLGGPGHMPDWWRWLTAPFALNYLTGHVAKWLGDVDLDG